MGVYFKVEIFVGTYLRIILRIIFANGTHFCTFSVRLLEKCDIAGKAVNFANSQKILPVKICTFDKV